MKKAALIVISGLLLFLFGVSISYRLALPDEEERKVDKYFIYLMNEGNNNAEYTLKLDDDKNYNLTVNEKDEHNVSIMQNNYDLYLGKNEYSIIKDVIDYFEKTYKINGDKEYKFYLNYEDYKEKIYPDDKIILIKMLQAVENISKGNDLVNGRTYKDIGIEMLREVEKEL